MKNMAAANKPFILATRAGLLAVLPCWGSW
jgi:hypothetical protein